MQQVQHCPSPLMEARCQAGAQEGESRETPQLPVEEMGLRGQSWRRNAQRARPGFPLGSAEVSLPGLWGKLPEVREERRTTRQDQRGRDPKHSSCPRAEPVSVSTAGQSYFSGRLKHRETIMFKRTDHQFCRKISSCK